MSTTARTDKVLGATPFLRTALTKVLGKRTAEQLAKKDVYSVFDLLRLLPRRYDTWGELTDLTTLVDGEPATVQAEVVRAKARSTRSGKPPALMEATVSDGQAVMDVVMFGSTWLMQRQAQAMAIGSTVLLSGKVNNRFGRFQLANPRIAILDELDEAERQSLRQCPLPIYAATEALPSWRVAKAVRVVLDQLTDADVPDPLPAAVRKKYGFVDALTAYKWVHTPQDSQQWQQGRLRLQFEEAFILQAALIQQRVNHARTHEAVAWAIPGKDSLRAKLDAALPFVLTAGQKRVGKQIEAALASTRPLQMLLQGDVGSGKTLVALRAMMQVVGGGGQVALLAPTEVLACQHRDYLEKMLGSLAHNDLLAGCAQSTRVHLLTSSTPLKRKQEILADLASGTAAIVVGTQALFSETVSMPFLGLVVVDEQHRFGVEQREILRERPDIKDPLTGQKRTPHLLVMTATPIPRTIAMTVFGNLDTAILDELPAGRKQITTYLVPWQRTRWVEGIWRRATQEIAKGGRVYVVCPRITPDEPDPEADTLEPELSEEPGTEKEIAAVGQWVEKLRTLPILEGINIGMLTGRMSSAEKKLALDEFISGHCPLLVSTTVIEVGVDVPEASMMVILDADRFGLSQLHQLRGRVGRGTRESLCIAVTGVEVGSNAFHRLKAFAQTSDGFQLAEADLKLRNEGNVLGAAQSGRRSDLDLLRVTRDGAVIAQARAEVEALFAADPTLEKHKYVAQAIADRLDEESRAFLERV